MEDRAPQRNEIDYTEQEKSLAEGLDVEPDLIRALRAVTERIRATNVRCWANPLVG